MPYSWWTSSGLPLVPTETLRSSHSCDSTDRVFRVHQTSDVLKMSPTHPGAHMNRHVTRRRAGRFTTLVAGTVAASAVLAGCAAGATPAPDDGASAGAVDPDAIIEAGISYTLNGSFDPMVASGAVTVSANWHVFEGLVDLDPVTQEAAPALAADLP